MLMLYAEYLPTWKVGVVVVVGAATAVVVVVVVVE
jgi:hypothetical protein